MIREDYDTFSVTQFERLIGDTLFEYYAAFETQRQKLFYIAGIDPFSGDTPGECLRALYLGLKEENSRKNFVEAIRELLETRLQQAVALLLEDIIFVIFDLHRQELLVPLARCVCNRDGDNNEQKLFIFLKTILVIIKMKDYPSAQEALQILRNSPNLPLQYLRYVYLNRK